MTTYSYTIDWDGDGSFATSGDDITAYVEEATIRVGFSSESDHIADIGQCTLIVNNEDKRFSPAYTGGPLYGKLKPGKAVRIQATSGSTWTLFRGVITRFIPGSEGSNMPTMHIVCEDNMSILSRSKISLPLQENVTQDTLYKMICSDVWKGDVASGTITFSGNPGDDDTVTVGSTTYTFKTSVGATAYEVLIGATKEDTATNQAAAINDDQAAASGFGTATVRNPVVSASVSGAVVTVKAQYRGTPGNDIALTESAANVTVSGATLTGGTDEPAGLISFQAGSRTLSLAGDQWNEDSTSGRQAARDVALSEFGYFFAARDGTLTAWNRYELFKKPSETPALTISSEHSAIEVEMDESRIANRVVVSFVPRGTESTGVIARSQNPIMVPGSTGTTRWNRTQNYVGLGSDPDTEVPDPGDRIVRLPFVETTSGQIIGAKDAWRQQAGKSSGRRTSSRRRRPPTTP